MTFRTSGLSLTLFLSLCCSTSLAAKQHSKDKKLEHLTSSSSSSCHKHHSDHDCKTCKEPVKIDKVPYTIHKSGKYCVDKDLVYHGTDAAITINASNVTLNFNNHGLRLKQTAATGILIQDQSEVAIQNDAITYDTRSDVAGTAAIRVIGSEKVSFDNLLIHNAFTGIRVENSEDIRCTKVRWTEAQNAALLVLGSQDLYVDDCSSANTFQDFLTAGIAVGTDTSGVFFNNLSLYNTDIFLSTGRNAILENTNVFINDPNYIYGCIQVGSPNADTPWQQVIIRNSTFSNLPGVDTATAASCFLIPSCEGALVENCLMECNTVGEVGNESAVVSIGANLPVLDQFSAVHNIRFENCIMKNVAQIGFIADAPAENPNSDIVINNCQIHDAREEGVRIRNTTSLILSNSTVSQNTGPGIVVGENAFACTVVANNVSNNCGEAIVLAAGSENNIVKDNTVLHNGDGIINDGAANLLIGNIEFVNNLVCE